VDRARGCFVRELGYGRHDPAPSRRPLVNAVGGSTASISGAAASTAGPCLKPRPLL
jgi:hypothetical protein